MPTFARILLHSRIRSINSCRFHLHRMSSNLADMRKAYGDKTATLEDEQIKAQCPYKLFQEWFDVARGKASTYNEANAVCLASSTREGFPSSRMVLLKGFEPNTGLFTIFTNYESRKGKEIIDNPNVALLFHWDFLSRQVRVEGRASKTSSQVSDEYFQKRPPAARVNARISQQSCVAESRSELEKLSEKEAKLYLTDNGEKIEGVTIPRPENWGGFVIEPRRFEFWQGQSDRLHDRFQFDKQNDGTWLVKRLQP